MHRKYRFLPLLFVMLSLVLTTTTLYAASLKDRMAARIPTINALKDSGLIGENNSGFLEYRTGQQPDLDVLQAENTDRQTVYTAIANKEGVTPTLVGERRAQMIADKGKGGHWYQSPDGKWYKK